MSQSEVVGPNYYRYSTGCYPIHPHLPDHPNDRLLPIRPLQESRYLVGSAEPMEEVEVAVEDGVTLCDLFRQSSSAVTEA